MICLKLKCYIYICVTLENTYNGLNISDAHALIRTATPSVTLADRAASMPPPLLTGRMLSTLRQDSFA